MEKETIVLSVNDFDELKRNSWAGALQTLDAIKEKGKEEEFLSILNDILTMNAEEKVYWNETQLNDFIWFEDDYIEEILGVKLWEE